jgi:organic radical activating enzyme
MKQNNLAVAETFLSIQGEGKTTGIPSYFLRLAGCNLICGGKGTEKDGMLHDGATWRCDTIEVWLKGKKKSHDEVIEMLGGDVFLENMRNGFHLVITGGEPLLQQNAIIDFIRYLYKVKSDQRAYFIEIETNCTIIPDPLLISYVNLFNISPKLKNSGMALNATFFPSVIQKFCSLRSNQYIFKFVISHENDFIEIREDYFPMVDRRNVYLMPGADNRAQLEYVSPMVAELAIKNKTNYSNRLHIQIWDKKTGV